MADVIDYIEREARNLDFFGTVELLEKLEAGRSGVDPLSSGRIQFESDPSLAFPPSDMVSIERRGDRIVFKCSFMGLAGASSPLPVYFADFIAAHEADAGALLDFLTIFNHRMYVFFYRAWKKYRMISPGRENGYLKRCIAALAGINDTAAQPADMPERLIAYTGLFAGKARGAAGLSTLLSDFFDGAPVRLHQFMPRWAPLPDPTRLGEGENGSLGVNTIVGTSIYDLSGKFRVEIGPLGAIQFERFLPNGKNHTLAKKLIEAYCNEPFDYDIEVLLQSLDLITVELGRDNARLGENAGLGDTTSSSGVKSMLLEGRTL
jgi:type VI secretion system protein ImpH